MKNEVIKILDSMVGQYSFQEVYMDFVTMGAIEGCLLCRFRRCSDIPT